jgi:hypothetical protein
MTNDELSTLYLHPEAESASVRDAVRRNPQVHDAVRTASADEALRQSGLEFYNDKPANLDCLSERPEHRVMIYLRAQGKTTKEIAAATGYSYHWVGQILRQPWFKKRLVELLDSEGRDSVQNLLKAEVMPSLEKLIEIRDDPKARQADQISSVKELLDRFLGKSVAKVETKTTLTVQDAATEAENNARELQKVNEELAARGINNSLTSSN